MQAVLSGSQPTGQPLTGRAPRPKILPLARFWALILASALAANTPLAIFPRHARAQSSSLLLLRTLSARVRSAFTGAPRCPEHPRGAPCPLSYFFFWSCQYPFPLRPPRHKHRPVPRSSPTTPPLPTHHGRVGRAGPYPGDAERRRQRPPSG